MRACFLLIVVVAAVICGGCATRVPDRPPSSAPLSSTQIYNSLGSNLKTVENLAPHLAQLDQDFKDFHQQGNWVARGYFSNVEMDEIELLLFRFVAVQTTLWDLISAYGGLAPQSFGDEVETKAHVLSITSALLLASHAAFVVAEFANDPIAIAQINQAYFRSEIDFGSYDRMRDNATAPDILESVAYARTVISKQTEHPDSPLSRLSDSDPAYHQLIVNMPARQAQAEKRLQKVAILFPSHSKAEAMARKDAKDQHQSLYAVRSVLFKDVSRLKNPTSHLIKFSDTQKRAAYDQLQPGDIVLTYTAGYASDIFIPGAFKHGITYIGTPDQREGLSLSPDMLPGLDHYEPATLASNLKQRSLADGKNADVIEAVAEGVIFNNLAHIMATHVNRLLVLRPRLNDVERAEFLLGVFSYLGDGYDFRFDFANVSQQVCTEVIYRALNEKGPVAFTLVERAGHPTLSADDIANVFLESTPQAFDFVLYAEEKPGSDNHEAMVLSGAAGRQRLAALMVEQQGTAK
jgi:hypothetical protein